MAKTGAKPINISAQQKKNLGFKKQLVPLKAKLHMIEKVIGSLRNKVDKQEGFLKNLNKEMSKAENKIAHHERQIKKIDKMVSKGKKVGK